MKEIARYKRILLLGLSARPPFDPATWPLHATHWVQSDSCCLTDVVLQVGQGRPTPFSRHTMSSHSGIFPPPYYLPLGRNLAIKMRWPFRWTRIGLAMRPPGIEGSHDAKPEKGICLGYTA